MKENRFWHGRRVLVTGCTGFLGSWVTSRLVELGAEVVGLVRDQVPHSYLNRAGTAARINVVHGDLTDPTVIRRALGEYEVDCVFHLAAQAIVGVANNDPVSTFEANIRGTWLLLEACRQQPRVTRIVIASSDKAYGSHEELPYAESFPLQGDHPYDVSKSCADLIAHTYHHTYSLPVCITRCGNLFGGGDLNFNRIVPGTIRWALEGERPIIRSDGTPMRDYIYVRDAVDAYLLLARSMDDPAIHGQAFNFGTANPLSVRELTLKILSLMSREDLEPLILDEAKAEILHQYLSSEKAGRLLGWKPVADLDQGLRETIDWYTEFFLSDTKTQIV